jgi:hypothetical protein
VRGAAALAVGLALAAAGCGGGTRESDRTSAALTGLYAIDHGGADPTGDALGPYEAAFAKVVDDCHGTVDELASGIQNVADDASNGSGTTVTNLDALRAVETYLEDHPQSSTDCRGVFVGVEAYLEGDALGN